MFWVGANVCLERGKLLYIYTMKPSFLVVFLFFGVLPLEALSKSIAFPSHKLTWTEHTLMEFKQDKPSKNEVSPKETAIKVVPKSRRQVKPTVVKAKVKVKPIKIIRPKMKRP
jgi:hypothetical protein